MPVARTLGVHVDVDRGDGGEVDHGARPYRARPAARRRREQVPVGAGRADQRDAHRQPASAADAGRQRDDREARPVPVVRQRDLVEVAEGARRSPRPRSRATIGRVGSTIASIRCSANQSTQRRRPPRAGSGRATYSSAVIARRSRMLEKVPRSSGGSVPPVVEAAVPDEHLGENEVEAASGPQVELGRRAAARPRSPGRCASARSNPSATSGSSSAIRGETAHAAASGAPAAASSRPSPRAAARSRPPSGPSARGGRRSGRAGRSRACETRPRVGLIVDVPHSREGMRSEPAVSVPVAAGTCPRGERRAGAAARAARRALERPRVADLVGRPAAGELVRVQVAEQHHPLARSAAPRRRSRARDLVQHPARRGQRLPRDRVEVLQPDRDAAEERRVAGREPLVGALGSGARVLLVDPHPGVDRAGSPSWLCVPSRSRMRARQASVSSREETTLAAPAATHRGRPRRSRRDRRTPAHGPWYTRRMAPSATPPFRADHVGSLLRPPELLRRRARTAPPGRSTPPSCGRRGRGDPRRRARCRRRSACSRRPTASSAARRGTWTSSTGSAASPEVPERAARRSSSTTRRATSSSRPAGAARRRASSASRGDDLRRRLRLPPRRRRRRAVPKLTIPSPSMVHYRGGARRDRPRASTPTWTRSGPT